VFTGQDGGHLAELLHKKGYEVFGIIRGQQNPKKILVEREQPYVKLIEGDLTRSFFAAEGNENGKAG
jgi:GDPmannose 4,6-dehydratase